ncbi:anchored repeat-type ABC transporter ATP-binding subunit [Corynebacterium auris]|uniref:anchored repeat-type ABC transporter ATP-binding subunit n=1 Tax=Corynebacterium auris TaxID=44750 RepID=UPI0025B52B0D|nr:anchored repeat-type ABC transporter ATP-binding subunit [Corynebacterium auris]WJY67894.1 High-affinity zinc uptake system ATP-binding protein ZnuC [Corynebacterium auris]
MSVLTVEDLAVSLAGRPVIGGACLCIDEGEFVGLLGPNGAGKTTLLRSILGLIPIEAGRVDVCGKTGRAVRDLIGYVPQRHEVAWDFPIDVRTAVMGGRTGLIGFFRRPGAKDHEAVDEALERVRLSDLSHRPIGELSGGQRQRVLVARALATRPKVLLLDEPFTGLDIPSSEQLLELFDNLAGQGTAIVMSTHNLAEAVHACHRLVLFNRTVVAEGSRARLNIAQPWIDTFGVRPDSPLLSAVGVNA